MILGLVIVCAIFISTLIILTIIACVTSRKLTAPSDVVDRRVFTNRNSEAYMSPAARISAAANVDEPEYCEYNYIDEAENQL